ncbi:MAG: fluoride efflux transporter CrcB [Bryobacteraceae bacterium]
MTKTDPTTLYLAIAIGSALGGVARFWTYGFAARVFGETFPYGTLTVNVAGSLVIGVLFALTAPDGRLLMSPALRLGLTAGLCGGFTTFSTFSLETMNLLRLGDWPRAGLNILGNVLLCLFSVWLGFAIATTLNRR